MKNTTGMLDAIFKNFVKDLDKMSRDELIAELTYYIEKEVSTMGSDEIRATYQYMTEQV